MSDGPHRSLPMRRAWQNLAERADKRAWSPNEVAEAMRNAVRDDFKREIPPDLLKTLSDALEAGEEHQLFPNQTANDLDAIRDSLPPGSFAESILDHVESAFVGGLKGKPALSEAIRNACIERGAEGTRQVEEHYKREAGYQRTDNVRERLEASLQSNAVLEIGSELVDLAHGSGNVGAPTKDTSLDAGPELVS